MTNAQKGFQSLLAEMNSRFFERTTELNRLFVCAVAQGNYLLLGSPGTAKTHMIEVFSEHVQTSMYGNQLFRTSTPEELWGPLDMIQFKAGTHCRVMTNTLAQARIGFIDEIFKGNSAINNSLLRAAEVSSRKFKNGTLGWIDLPLKLLVAASNELPEGGTKGELSALYDRFEVKRVVRYIEDPKNFEAMLRLDNVAPITTMLNDATLLEAGDEAKKIIVPDAVYAAVVGVWATLKQQGIIVSDRKFRNTIRYLKASAWIDGRTEATDDDVEILADMLWDDPEQYPVIRKVVMQFTNPISTQAIELYDVVVEKYSKVKQSSGQEQSRIAVELNSQLKHAQKTIQGLISAAKREGKSATIAEQRLESIVRINEELVNTILL